MWTWNERQFRWELWGNRFGKPALYGWIVAEALYPVSRLMAAAVYDRFGSVPPPLEEYL